MSPTQTIVFFSSYPHKDETHSAEVVGGAAYTKSLLLQLHKQAPQVGFTVYAERFNDEAQPSHIDQGIQVKQSWKRNNIHSIFQSVRDIARQNIDSVVVSYEINMVGGVMANIVFLLALTFHIFKRKKIYFILHQVVDSFDDIEENKIWSTILFIFKECLFSYIAMLATELIVFEKQLEAHLPGASKAQVIPLAIDGPLKITKEEARKKLGLNQNEFYLLYFGFLSPYKGIDTFLDLYTKEMGHLIIAGDGNPNHARSESYNRFLTSVKSNAVAKGATLTGFIPEELIPYYFAACDLVILPYKMFFSSSYPLSFAFSHKKPVLLSPALSAYFKSEDMRLSAKEAGLPQRQVTFELDTKDVLSKIEYIKSNNDKFVAFASHISNYRNWSTIAQKYLQILHIM